VRNLKKTLLLFMIWLAGCGAPITKQPTVTLTSLATPSPIVAVNSSTQSISEAVLQLVYTNSRNQDFGEVYAVDITCMTSDLLCFGEPHILLKTPGRTSSTTAIDSPGSISDYAWSSDGKKIALCAIGLNGRGDIFFTNTIADSPTWNNLTHSFTDECNPKWDKSGEYIFYLGGSDDPYGGDRLFGSNLSGDEKQIWLEKDDASISFYDISLDNKKAVFTKTDSNGYDQIYVSDLDGSNLQQVTSGDWDHRDPSFSPDAETIVFVRWNRVENIDSVDQSDIIVKNLGTGVEKNITEEIEKITADPVFSPDGKWIAFNSLDPTAKEANIFAYSIEKSVLIQITPDNTYYVNPSWRWFMSNK